MRDEVRGANLETRIIPVITAGDLSEKEELLRSLNFVKLPAGRVQLGTPHPLPCAFEGHRINETPIREIEVGSFWVCKFVVTNQEFEEFNPKRERPPTSLRGKQPATNVTYYNALKYARFLSEKHHLYFTLPTEPEWVYAASPYGWEFPYQQEKSPDSNKAHNFVLGSSEYITLDVDDPRFSVNYCGLYHMGGNVEEFTLGSYYISTGSWGAETDGRYCIVKGGNFGHCSFSSGVQRRGIVDVSDRSERLGFRLTHLDFVIEDK